MKNKVWAYIIGTGLALFAIHNPLQPAKEYAFLPAVGLVFSLLGTIVVLSDNRKNVTLGSKWVWIPLAVIALSIGLSGIGNGELGYVASCFMFGGLMFSFYLVARVLGQELLKPFAWAVVIGALGCIAFGLVNPGVKTGGFIISPTNYDMATGLLVFGTVVSIFSKQWLLATIALLGLVFTGAEQAMFITGALFLVVIIRKDFGKRLLLPAGVATIALVLLFTVGAGAKLYEPAFTKIAQAKAAVNATTVEERDNLLEEATGYRWITHWRIDRIKPFGYGYNMTQFYHGIPHSIVLIIIQQVGIVAALAWLVVAKYCLIKTKWKYAWITMIGLGAFDHYFWTQAAPWFWVLAGVSTASNIKADYIFRR